MKRKLAPVATNPGYVVVEAIDAADGGVCLAVNGRRVAGCEPALTPNNIVHRWNVDERQLREASRLPQAASMAPANDHRRWLLTSPVLLTAVANKLRSCFCFPSGVNVEGPARDVLHLIAECGDATEVREVVAVPIGTHECGHCGAVFSPRRRDAQYCSDSCRNMASRKRVKERGEES